MRDGEAGFVAGAVGIKGIFDDVVAGGADGVDEELAGELGEGEAGADVGAVDRYAADAGGGGLFPLGEDLAGGVEEAEPEADALAAVAGPVVGGDEAGVEAGSAGDAGVAKEGVVGGEVGLFEVARLLGEHVGGQLEGVERDDRHAVRDHEGDAVVDAGGVEGGDQEGAGGRVRQVGQGGGGDAGSELADLGDVVDEEFGGCGHRGVHRPEGGGDGVGVVDGEGRLESRGEALGLFGDERVGEGLVDDVAAGAGIEGLDVEHGSLNSPGGGGRLGRRPGCRRWG